jgi:type I restriction enzyme S subunit
MSAQMLIDEFHLFTAAPNGVQKLRALILSLAVRGKLVVQDPADEPASELLKRIWEHKAKPLVSGKIKNQKPLLKISDCEKTYALPHGWALVRLGYLCDLVTSGSRDWAQHYASSGAIFVRMGNLSRGSYKLRLENIQFIRPPQDGEGRRTRLAAGDILISITGEVGLLGLIPSGFGEAYINQHICMVRLSSFLTGRYVLEFLRSDQAVAQYEEPQRGIKNSFRLTDVTEILLPLPPLAEQQRIVAKVDELMALCDQLEAQLMDARELSSKLVAAVADASLALA